MIYNVITGRSTDGQLESQINELEQLDASKVILGYTELSVTNDNLQLTDVIDPLELVADKIVAN